MGVHWQLGVFDTSLWPAALHLHSLFALLTTLPFAGGHRW
jgi:hypothetical protein